MDEYTIPGGMLCTICGLTYYSQSMGGPGVCPSCDCGNSGPQLVAQQRKEIERLRAEADDWQWGLRQGEHHFGSLYKQASLADIRTARAQVTHSASTDEQR